MKENVNDQAYTNRELYMLIERNQAVYLEAHSELKKTVDSILEQAKRTNGSIMSLKMWRSWMTGVGAIIMTVVLPLVTYIFINNVGKVEAKIDQHISQTK